eukprot:Pgem_evm1s14019
MLNSIINHQNKNHVRFFIAKIYSGNCSFVLCCKNNTVVPVYYPHSIRRSFSNSPTIHARKGMSFKSAKFLSDQKRIEKKKEKFDQKKQDKQLAGFNIRKQWKAFEGTIEKLEIG